MTADQLRQLAAEAGFEQVMKHKDGSTTVLPDALFERFAALVLAAQSPAEGDADRHRLDFIQANPNLTLRYYKRHWSLAGVTSYEHRVFKTVREAIDHAMNGGKDD